MALKGTSNSAPAIGKADFRRHLDAAFARSTRRREILFQPFRMIEPAKASPTIEATEAEFVGFRGLTAEQLEAQLLAVRAQEFAEAEADKPPVKRFFQRLIRSGAGR